MQLMGLRCLIHYNRPLIAVSSRFAVEMALPHVSSNEEITLSLFSICFIVVMLISLYGREAVVGGSSR